ncbi:MAG: hypothetical protein COW59_12030 [Lysobacterales bacterium CG17_big_fil_post_rev_8_21_14_2_50_64_11]|nr:MAG: hypothetical protein COW59_12030 [Xanthomonadales bacterium CG17_big_fil_post_rev_8_21_14_2_50_64_11]
MQTLPPLIGKYRISRLLGSGGMGRVYLGTDPDIGRQVAIKMIHLGAGSGDDARERFVREARTMGRLNHPNIVTLLEYGVAGETPYLVLEFVQGEDLSDWLRRPHPLLSYVRLMRDLAAAIAAAHAAGILHRDIKADNVRVLADDRCKLLDFGIADDFDDSRLTSTGSFVGTAEYLAPEVIAGQRHSEQSDIYSIGLLSYHALAGFNPFRTDNVASTLARIMQFTPVPLAAVREGISPALSDLVMKCLNRDPDRRPPSAEHLSAQLDNCLKRIDPALVLAPVSLSADGTAAIPVHAAAVGRWRQWASFPGMTIWQRIAVAMVVLSVAVLAWQPLRPILLGTPASAPARPPERGIVGRVGSRPPASATIPAQAETSNEPAAREAASELATQPSRSEPDPPPMAAARSVLPIAETRPTSRPVATADSGGETHGRGQRDALPAAAAVGRNSATQRDRVGGAGVRAQSSTSPASSLPPALGGPSPVAALPTITGSSHRLLSRGRPTRLQLRGEHLGSVSDVVVMLGTRVDERFTVDELVIADDGNLSVRIAPARNLPFGRYPLVLQSPQGNSPPYLIEISL